MVCPIKIIQFPNKFCSGAVKSSTSNKPKINPTVVEYLGLVLNMS